MSNLRGNRILLTVVGMLFATTINAQRFNELGNPLITYYPEEAGIPEQTWTVAEDLRGVMYFGTNVNGILEYDGKTWRTISTNSLKVHSMAIDSSTGIVYVGLEGDFGMLKPDNNGTLTYQSLRNLLNNSLEFNAPVYKTYVNNNTVYFCTPLNIMALQNNRISNIKLPDYSFFTSMCRNELLVSNLDHGLMRVSQNQVIPEKTTETLKEMDTYAVVAVNPDENWMFTSSGIFKLNLKNGQTSTLADSKHILKSIPQEGAIPYSASILGNGNVGAVCVNTNWLSYIELAPNGEPVSILNPKSGLRGSQITNLYQVEAKPLWLTFYDGPLAKVETMSPIRHFASTDGLDGAISSITRINGRLFVGTSNGIYCQIFDKKGFPSFTNIYKSDVWKILDFRLPSGKSIPLVAAYTNGVQRIDGQHVTPFASSISHDQPLVMSLLQSKKNPNRLFIGTSNAIYRIDCQNGRAIDSTYKPISCPEHNIGEVQNMVEDKFGNLWASSGTKHLVCYANNGKTFISFENFDFGNTEIYPLIYNDSLFVLSGKGIFSFNYKDTTFIQGGIVGHMFDNQTVAKATTFENGIIFVIQKNREYFIEFIQKDSLGNFTKNSTPFKRLPKKLIGAFYNENNILWMGIQKELYSYNQKTQNLLKQKHVQPYNTLIRQVKFKDSLFFNGAYLTNDNNEKEKIVINQPENKSQSLSYRYNAVTINYSATFYEKEENTQFSHYLKGSDEEAWSKWDTRTEVTYTNLREGSYTFMVKAKNVYDVESTLATFSFEIDPPWYRTILAYFIYLVGLVLIVWGLIRWNSRRLIAEKERLEKIVQARTAEVVAQKEEIEQQKSHIEQQNEEITSSIEYASRIQRAILSPEDQVKAIFPEHFILYLPRDIVSGDFYVIMQVGNKKISVVADCTGHGVPGGFMSMLGMSSISEIITKHANDLHPDKILNLLREKVISSLHQTGEVGTSKDGMDLALYIIDESEMTLEFAGANNSLILIRNNELIQIKADKMPVGIYLKGNVPFKNNVMEIQKGDVIYTFSDGYADQFGGPDKRKFMIKNLKNLFLEIHQKPMKEQREILNTTLLEWHGTQPRIDDVVVMGVRI